MGFSRLGRVAVVGAAVLGVVSVVAACGDDDDWGHRRGEDQATCGTTVQQCRQVCNYWCDDFQCYPDCGNDCWDQCVPDGGVVVIPLADGAAPDAGTVDASTDAAAPVVGDAGTGVLCSACTSNSDCESGSLCILKGGTTAQGFCGHACTTSNDCPTGFLCSQIGSTRQCLPTGNACQ